MKKVENKMNMHLIAKRNRILVYIQCVLLSKSNVRFGYGLDLFYV